MSWKIVARTLLLLLAGFAGAALAAEPAPRKLVTVGPAITEIVFALGEGERIVGVDESSRLPSPSPAVRQVGYRKTLSAEGLLTLGAGLILATEEAGPPAVLEQVRGAGVEVVILANKPTVEDTRRRIREVARRVGQEARGEALVTALEQDLARVAARVQALPKASRPRVLAIHTRGPGVIMASGGETPADGLIQLAGGVNVIGSYPGHRPLTAEAVVEAAPDILLLPAGSLESLGGEAGLARLPGLSATRGWRVATLEDIHFMDFGPRLGKAVERLVEQIHPVKREAP